VFNACRYGSRFKNNIVHMTAVSTTTMRGVEELKKELIEIARKQRWMGMATCFPR
jgi:selenocysteine-specific translation elongation factor